MPSSESGDFAQLFLRHAPKPAAQALASAGELNSLLEGMIRAAKQAWPGVCLADESFLAHLAARLPEREPEQALRALHCVDLYLACACAQSDPAALSFFDKRFLARIPEVLRTMDPSGALSEEVEQQVREKLLLPGPGGRARIANYGGRGPLLTWVRATAVRTATDLRRGEKEEVPVDEVEPFAQQLHSADPELEYIKNAHREDFKTAFNVALESLSPQQRNVLRLYLIDRLNIGAIGQLYGTHRSTIARWIVDARGQLLDQTRQILARQLRLSAPELESLMGLVRSQLDLSINTFLRDGRK
jgi:RNA polymerase sigma-70 factor (ECF subfamily)